MSRTQKLLSALLTLCLLLGCRPHCRAVSDDALAAALERSAAYVAQTAPKPQVGSVGGEWAVLGLARSDLDVPQDYFEGYLSNVEETVTAKGGVLHTRKYTEYSRLVLTLSALGQDARNVAGYDLTLPLGDYEATIRQGLNGPICALLALDSRGYPMPRCPQAKTQATRQMYVAHILARQLPGGGWSLTGQGEAEADLTGMALQALAKYQDQEPVREAVQAALARMSQDQDGQGGYSSWGSANAESVAQMLCALGELDIPLDDPRFVKNGRGLLDALLSFQCPDGGFRHTAGSQYSDLMTSEQGLYALAAAKRLQEGQGSLYRMEPLAPQSLEQALVLARQRLAELLAQAARSEDR